ncbi:MAG: hypothetical protein GF308_01675 [Candidatus Heimdallarchaeota archaeon]|nr:hypothetical protein [Candidatus Heimdallarchaeota archaeon]
MVLQLFFGGRDGLISSDSTNEKSKGVSKALIISPVCSVIGVALFTSLITTTPILLVAVNDGENPSGKDFFYQWNYNYDSYSNRFYLTDIQPSTGYRNYP